MASQYTTQRTFLDALTGGSSVSKPEQGKLLNSRNRAESQTQM